MKGISITEEKFWLVFNLNPNKRHSSFSGMGLQTSFPYLLVPEIFDIKQAWIDRCGVLGIPVDDEFLDED